MEFEEGGKRKEYLKTILGFLAEIYSALFNGHRGIRAIRFLNNGTNDNDDRTADNMSQRAEIEGVINNHVFDEGLTSIGTGLMKKILRPFVFSDEKWVKGTPRKMRNMERPLLIMVITNGAVSLPIALCQAPLNR